MIKVVKNEPKIVLWDLETLPNLKEVMKVYPQLSNYPGLTLKASITSVICAGYMTLGADEKIRCINAWDFKTRWRKNVNDDYAVVKKIAEILSAADLIVTHNGKRFDLKFLQTRLFYHGLPPLPKIPHIDTCAEGKKNLLAFNNRLDTLAGILTDERKTDNGGWDLWVRVLNREPKAMKLMTDYCKQDVNVLHKIFLRLKPILKSLPNENLFAGPFAKVCPCCGSMAISKQGIRTRKTGVFQAYRCRNCYSWSQTKLKTHALPLKDL